MADAPRSTTSYSPHRALLTQVLLSLLAAAFLYLHIRSKVALDTISVSLLLLGTLPWFLPLLGGQIKSIELFGTKVEWLESRILSQENLLRILTQAAEHNLTESEARILVALTDTNASPWESNGFLRNEMIRLCQHGFVKEIVDRGVWQIPTHEGEKVKVKDLVAITDKGIEHIALVKELRSLAKSK